MSPGQRQLARDAVRLIDPAPGTPVFPLDRARPGIREADLPRFGEPRWQLATLDHAESGKTLGINWEEFPSSLRAGFMRAGWAVINVPTPGVLLHRSGSSTRPRLSPGSLQRTFRAWKFFADWLTEHQVCRLDQTGRRLLEEYPRALRDRGLARAAVTLEMFTITRLWAYAPFLLPEDRIPMPPWDQAGARTGDFLGETAQSPGENTTIPIHPAVMSPLLIWALRAITDFAPDIIAAWRETRRLLGRVPSQARPAGREDILTYLQHLRETRQPLPVFAGARAGILARAHRAMARQRGKTVQDRPLIHNASSPACWASPSRRLPPCRGTGPRNWTACGSAPERRCRCRSPPGLTACPGHRPSTSRTPWTWPSTCRPPR